MQSKRNSLKKLAGVGVVSVLVPKSWTSPMVDAVLLPAHAQTSSCRASPEITFAAQASLESNDQPPAGQNDAYMATGTLTTLNTSYRLADFTGTVLLDVQVTVNDPAEFTITHTLPSSIPADQDVNFSVTANYSTPDYCFSTFRNDTSVVIGTITVTFTPEDGSCDPVTRQMDLRFVFLNALLICPIMP